MSDIHKDDDGKAKLTLVPRAMLFDIAYVRMYGLKKYPETGEHGWKNLDIDRIRNAAYRHFVKYLDDPDGVDAESGLPHLWHLACNIAFLCERERWYKHDDEWVKIHKGEVEDDSKRSVF